MPWRPSEPDEVPTLGWYVLDWMAEYLARPAVGFYEPFRPYREQEDFILRWYELDPVSCQFRFDRALLGRPRGWGKSPMLAALCAVEALGEVVPAGWDHEGQPVGRPWADFRTPLVHVAAVSEAQTRNTWGHLQEMLAGPAADEYGVEAFDTVVKLRRGSIEQLTTSPRTVKGAPATFAVLDQTEEWVPSNRGPRLAQNIRTNTSKNGCRTVEAPNAFFPGEGSVAEASWKLAQDIREGRARLDGALLFDHREAPPDTDLADRDSLIAGLRVSYGDASGHPGGCVIHDPPCPPGHVDLDAQVLRIWDPAIDVQVARSDYLNQITHSSDAWLSSPEWWARSDPSRLVGPDEPVTLGFDGSRSRGRGIADATALVGCRVSDGHVFLIECWEQREPGEWRVPAELVDAEVARTFDRFNVVGFYADPARWESYIASWEARFGARLRVKAARQHPVEWWMTGGRSALVARAVEQLHAAVVDGEMTHDGSSVLARHVLNARRRVRGEHLHIAKEHQDSPNKIDAAVAAVLAWQARLDAMATGVGESREPDRRVRRW